MNIKEAMAAVGDRLTEYGQFQNRKHFDMPEYREGVAEKTKAVAAAVRDAMMAAVEEACGLERDICEKYEKQSMVHARHSDFRREIEEAR